MKKLLSMLAIALVLCLACAGLASATTVEVEIPAHEHTFTYEAKEEYVTSWPGKDNDQGWIQFVCTEAKEYGSADVQKGVELQNKPIKPTEHNLPETLEDALKLQGTDRVAVDGYKAPTCTEDGYIIIKCDHKEELYMCDAEGNKISSSTTVAFFHGWKGDCDVTHKYTIPATGHTWGSSLTKPQYYHKVEPTCHSTGEAYDYCVECAKNGDIVFNPDAEMIVLDMVDHNMPETPTSVTPATCVADGKEVYHCQNEGCNYYEEKILPKNNKAHVFGEWVTVKNGYKEPTCTEAGHIKQYRSCTVCLIAQELDEKDIPALGHNMVEVDRKPSTCGEKGTVTKKCTRCDYTETEELALDPTNHPKEYIFLVEDESTAPTCEKDGLNTYQCKLCEAKWTETVDAHGHDPYVEYTPGKCAINDKDAVIGCTVTKCKNKDCDLGGTIKTEYDEAAPEHDYGDWIQQNPYSAEGKTTPAYWIRECKVCGHIDEMIRNDDKNPNDDCFGGHTPGEVVIENEVEATCEEDGSYEEVVYCTVCGNELSREPVVVPAAGHVPGEAVVENVVEATVEADGSYEEVVYCTVCGKELSRTLVTVEAIKDGIVEEDGYQHVYENGEPSTKSGLTNVNGEWYYLAAGYVDTEFTGLAPFAGNWWTVENGKLINRDANGLVEFQGQMYAISEGMVWTNWDGIHWLNDEEAYLLARGAWQSDYSGVYPEDGNLILIKDGKVDHDATTATVDGKVYKCVNGIVQVR